MSFVLGTTHTVVKWYVFDTSDVKPGKYTLVDQLDFRKVPVAGDKQTAKFWATQLGLSSWRYVKIPA